MQKEDFVLHRTADGSDTLFSPGWQESYHSINGALQESRHVFIEAGLNHLYHQAPSQAEPGFDQSGLKENLFLLSVLEIGFGTGLNALLTWSEAIQKGLSIRFESLEAFPLSPDNALNLNYGALIPTLPPDAFERLHRCNWEKAVVLEPERFSLTKRCCDFTLFEPQSNYNLIYFDAFAPEKQPEMWEESLLARLFDAMESGGILVTYCAKGEVRRRLQRCGFTVERLPGPPGKREMLRARKPEAFK